MSFKFVQSSDNKYVQARLMANTFTTDVTQWQGVDDEPTAGSNNLVKSGGVYPLKSIVDYVDSVNLFDKSKRTDGYYVRKDTGGLMELSGRFTTDYIPIDSAGCYANYGLTGGTYYGYACYNSNKAYTHWTDSKQATYQEGDA
jgi:hypothetical protein